MNRMFGSMAMIDVLSICVLTLLILSLSSEDSTTSRSDDQEPFASSVMTVRAKFDWAKDRPPPVRPPLLGAEVVLGGTSYGTTNMENGILKVENQGSNALIFMRAPLKPTTKHYLHVFIKDKGELPLDDITVSVVITNHPLVKNPSILTAKMRESLSWEIPLYFPDGVSQFTILPSAEGNR